MVGLKRWDGRINRAKMKLFLQTLRVSQILIVSSHCHSRHHPLRMCRVGDKTYWKAFTTLGFDALKSWENFKTSCQNKATVDAPWLYICTALIVSQPLVYPYANGNFGHSRVVSISYTAWGFSCCSFLQDKAILRCHRAWSERQCRASRFLFVFTLL
jgi:hypothetical protein